MATEQELKDKLAEVAEKSRAKAAAADDARRIKVLEEKLKLAELEESSGGVVGQDLAAVFSPKDGRMVVVKTPRPVVYQKFEQKIANGKMTTQDVVEFVYPCIVYPSKADFEKIVDAAPAMLSHAANAAAGLAGNDRTDVEGK